MCVVSLICDWRRPFIVQSTGIDWLRICVTIGNLVSKATDVVIFVYCITIIKLQTYLLIKPSFASLVAGIFSIWRACDDPLLCLYSSCTRI